MDRADDRLAAIRQLLEASDDVFGHKRVQPGCRLVAEQ